MWIFRSEPLLAFDTVRSVLLHAKREGLGAGRIPSRSPPTAPCWMTKRSPSSEPRRQPDLGIDGRSEVHDRIRPMRGRQPTHTLVVQRAGRGRAKGGKNCYIRTTKHNLDRRDVKFLYRQGFRQISLGDVGRGRGGSPGPTCPHYVSRTLALSDFGWTVTAPATPLSFTT